MTGPEPEPSGQRLPILEFIVLMAMLFALTAFSIDAMLPALPLIAAELTPTDANRAQLVVGSFILGMGIGTFITGPLSDAFGRRRVILGGVLLFCAGAGLAWIAPSMELMIAARLLQGLGVAGPRIATMALVRDLHAGRQMARIMSIMMMVFVLVPAIAPLLGSFIIIHFGWRAIFLAFVLFAVIVSVWFGVRQHETLHQTRRRPLNAANLRAALNELLNSRVVVMIVVVMALAFATLFATIASIQSIFDQHFGRAQEFPYWFALIALVAGCGNILNARLVVKLGMRLMATSVFVVQIGLTGTVLALLSLGMVSQQLEFSVFLIWVSSIFFAAGMTIGNLNAIALEPMGHIAGMAASFVSALATVLSVLIAVPIGMAFNGTFFPLMSGVLLCCAVALPLMLLLPPAARDSAFTAP